MRSQLIIHHNLPIKHSAIEHMKEVRKLIEIWLMLCDGTIKIITSIHTELAEEDLTSELY